MIERRYDNPPKPPELIMELCPHGSLYQYIVELEKTNFYDPRVWLQAALQIAAGVEHLHKMNIVHRDLTPYNILIAQLEPRIQVKIGDFGLARQLIDGHLQTRTPSFGKPRWSAPEVHTHDPYQLPSEKSDIWSLALLIWWLSEHGMVLPFHEYSDETREERRQLIKAIAEKGIRPNLYNTNAEEHGLAPLLSQCWQRRSVDRPSATEVKTLVNTSFRISLKQTHLQHATGNSAGASPPDSTYYS